jgi:hypothetical protein
LAFNIEDYGISPAGLDAVRPFAVEGLDVRGRAVSLGPVVEKILERHNYPEPVSRVLAEAIVLTCLLGTSLKFDGRFTLQTRRRAGVHAGRRFHLARRGPCLRDLRRGKTGPGHRPAPPRRNSCSAADTLP